MRDVRQVDLPPRYQLDYFLIRPDVADIEAIPSPADGAPGIVVLDSGIITNHPLLRSAIGDSQSFVSGNESDADTTGHGTAVAGLALYGDVETAVAGRDFTPRCWLFCGKITDDRDANPVEFVENRVARAVSYFKEHYECRVFNLSFGDNRKPYGGAHVDKFAATLDTLAREQDVLFVVSAGNFNGADGFPTNWREIGRASCRERV